MLLTLLADPIGMIGSFGFTCSLHDHLALPQMLPPSQFVALLASKHSTPQRVEGLGVRVPEPRVPNNANRNTQAGLWCNAPDAPCLRPHILSPEP
jgi:hypothetical protein